MNESNNKTHLNFIEEIIEEDIRSNKHGGRIHTRFPPEPNGYLHIGHAKSICLNFGLAEKYNGKANLRFDDTNPVTEEVEYIESIKEDIRWLGFDWEDREFFASDYFPQFYQFAIQLIKAGKAFVDHSTQEEISKMRGIPTAPGTESPFRNRSISENLALFEEMKNGKLKEGECVLRAKINMSSPNMHLRDPIIYRILFTPHHRTGTEWCIYPMYDFAHGQSDSIEGITHSVCTLEFENHRPLYEWFIQELEIFPSRQIEFARLNVEYMMMSKRKLLLLVNEKIVSGWDDPRMPTISGMRRRGYPPEALRKFATEVGVAKRENLIEYVRLENAVREQLNNVAIRAMAVLRPLKVIISNYPEGVEWLPVENNPEDPNAGIREIPFGKEIYIEQEDFMEIPPPKYFRLSPGGMARLKAAYIIRCDEVVKNEDGSILHLLCSYFPESKSGSDKSGLKVKTTIHWIECQHALKAEIRLYEKLFEVKEPAGSDEDFRTLLHPNSLEVIEGAWIEPSLANAEIHQSYQFMRTGYFCLDKDSTKDHLIFNRTATLKETWLKT
ncbi:MAG: glutamine--tRNA ligase/YqeY domain fusion protein [Saprospiraceae bacterium]|nr:glutamine--tRNA ligase/YqeY domain fusion protein [Saprospiraceae bacterium]MBK7811961.1 glutamine--tRNA ligase/YqeY domain fusion protein [Saprospiraceae bacterium]MBK9632832.1 glutamine--tRNA ligase/YqeY domain fusion protein [Saprospiraceae bacterium]